MRAVNRSRITTAVAATLASLLFISSAIAFAPTPVHNAPHSSTLDQRRFSSTSSSSPTSKSNSQLPMSLSDVSDFYAQFPLQAAVLTCGVKASVADGIAQVRTSTQTATSKWYSDLEFRRNAAYIIYGGIFIGALCHYEYDVIFPMLFGTEHTLWISLQEVLFDNFVSGPLVWLPPAYFIKAIMYNYSLQEGLEKYVNDITNNGLLQKYWTIWVPAQSISFTVIPDHLRVVFMASVSFFWFILFSTVSSDSDSSSSVSNEVVKSDA